MPSVRAASRSFAFPPGRVVLMRFATASAHWGAEQQRKAIVIFALAPRRRACRSMALAVDALVAAHDAHREHPVRPHEPSSSRPIAPALTSAGSAAMRVVGARGTLGLALGIASGFATHVHAGENGLAVARVVPRPRAFHRTSPRYGHATARPCDERHTRPACR